MFIPTFESAVDWAHYGDCNVCSVDWSRLARYNYATCSTRHTRIVSNAIVYFMEYLSRNHGMNVEEVSIAGFSLGAQIAGLVGGSWHYQKVAAIYGLDPAGPGFSIPDILKPDERIDPTDAKYVQCVFTNQFLLGMSIDCGHANFYLNGGMWQPGCSSTDIVCSHQRAMKYFTESLNPEHRFIGDQCESYSKKLLVALTGWQCSDVSDRLGIHNEGKSGRFFVKTNAQPPFALRK